MNDTATATTPTIPDPLSAPGTLDGTKSASRPAPEPAPPAASSGAGDSIGDMLKRPLTVVVILLTVGLVSLAWQSNNKMQKLRMETARSLQKAELSSTATNALARSMQDHTRELQTKVALLENRQLEAQSQQLALEQMYQDLSKNRDEWALAEIEQVLSTASQQLQLAGNVQGALIALQNADRSLSRSDTPQFITIRRAIAKDIDKLKALPALDLAGVALRIDNVIVQIDTLPMLADQKPVVPDAEQRAPSAPAAQGGGVLVRARALWRDWGVEMWQEMRELVRVRTVDTPEALLLSPTETYFVRENLKLRLLNARLALLARNEVPFRNDLLAAQQALAMYFDTRAQSTQTAQALLRQVQANDLAIEMPSLSDSLNAVRNYKAKP